jgi:hypothetical protein
MVRQTSKQAYDEIFYNGLLSEARWKSYKDLFWNGPSTAREQEARTGDCNGHRRLRDLVDLGVALEVGTRVCTITGMEVVLWDVTDRLPSGVITADPVGPPRPKFDDLKVVVNILEGMERGAEERGKPLLGDSAIVVVRHWLEYQAQRARD